MTQTLCRLSSQEEAPTLAPSFREPVGPGVAETPPTFKDPLNETRKEVGVAMTLKACPQQPNSSTCSDALPPEFRNLRTAGMCEPTSGRGRDDNGEPHVECELKQALLP